MVVCSGANLWQGARKLRLGEHQRQLCLCCRFSWSKGDLSRPLCRLRLSPAGVCKWFSTSWPLCHLGGRVAPVQWAPAASNQVPDVDVEKAGPSCFYHFTFRVLSANCKDFCAIFFFLLVLAVIYNSTFQLMVASRSFGTDPLFKKKYSTGWIINFS
jgi:hypothetical protein